MLHMPCRPRNKTRPSKLSTLSTRVPLLPLNKQKQLPCGWTKSCTSRFFLLKKQQNMLLWFLNHYSYSYSRICYIYIYIYMYIIPSGATFHPPSVPSLATGFPVEPPPASLEQRSEATDPMSERCSGSAPARSRVARTCANREMV